MSLDTTRVRAFCFDIDGTLSDTDELWVNVFERSLQPFRFLFRQNEVKPFARWLVMSMEAPGNFVYQLLDRFGLDEAVGRIYNLLSRWRLGKKTRSFLMTPGTHDALNYFSEKFPLSVVSARDRETTLAFLEHFALSPFFKAIATSQTCKYTKPFPDPIHWAAERMGVRPDECVMVGDTVVDIRAGKAAGAQTVGLLCGFGTERELNKAGADLIVPDPASLMRAFSPSTQPYPRSAVS